MNPLLIKITLQKHFITIFYPGAKHHWGFYVTHTHTDIIVIDQSQRYIYVTSPRLSRVLRGVQQGAAIHGGDSRRRRPPSKPLWSVFSSSCRGAGVLPQHRAATWSVARVIISMKRRRAQNRNISFRLLPSAPSCQSAAVLCCSKLLETRFSEISG